MTPDWYKLCSLEISKCQFQSLSQEAVELALTLIAIGEHFSPVAQRNYGVGNWAK